MVSKRKTVIDNIEKLSAKSLILKIESQCEKELIDLDDCSIEILDGSIKIESNQHYWPDEGGMWITS